MKIGITEAGDAGIDFSWIEKLKTHQVDGAILITKDCNNNFIAEALPFRDKIIVHATCTGYGGTMLEPNVPIFSNQLLQAKKMVEAGLPLTNIVIRIDPIFPTKKGIETAEKVINAAIEYGFRRFRISLIDMYSHVKERFKKNKLRLPYGDNFEPSDTQITSVNKWLEKYNEKEPVVLIEACAEPKLKCIQQGCISAFDLHLMHLTSNDTKVGSYQRNQCMCLSCKTELLTNKQQCPRGCLYCYWKSNDSLKNN